MLIVLINSIQNELYNMFTLIISAVTKSISFLFVLNNLVQMNLQVDYNIFFVNWFFVSFQDHLQIFFSEIPQLLSFVLQQTEKQF